MRPIKEAMLAASCMLTLVACGGGGGGGAVPPPAVSKTINSSNYIDAVWGGGLAVTRAELLLGSVDVAFRNALRNGDTSNTFQCVLGGSLNYTNTANVRTITFNGCVFALPTGTTTLVGGSVSTPDGVLASAMTSPPASTTVNYLSAGTVTVNNFTIDWGTGPETIGGSFTLARQANLSAAVTGALSVNRNGRTENYTALNLRTVPFNVNALVSIDSGTLAVSTPRISFPFTVTADAAGSRSLAADSSAAQIAFSATGTSATYSRFNTYSAGATPDESRVLATNDPIVVAVIQRLLQ